MKTPRPTLTAREMLALNVAGIAILAPVAILGPNVYHRLPLLAGHWAALLGGLLGAAVMVWSTLCRERRARQEAKAAERQHAAKLARRVLSGLPLDLPQSPPAVEASALAAPGSSD